MVASGRDEGTSKEQSTTSNRDVNMFPSNAMSSNYLAYHREKISSARGIFHESLRPFVLSFPRHRRYKPVVRANSELGKSKMNSISRDLCLNAG